MRRLDEEMEAAEAASASPDDSTLYKANFHHHFQTQTRIPSYRTSYSHSIKVQPSHPLQLSNSSHPTGSSDLLSTPHSARLSDEAEANVNNTT